MSAAGKTAPMTTPKAVRGRRVREVKVIYHFGNLPGVNFAYEVHVERTKPKGKG